MNNLPKILSSKTKIRFQDCDPFNHLNNGNYTNYFMNHREDQLIEEYDLDIYKMAKSKGRSWVSSSNQLAFLKPALLMETVTIESQLIKYTESELIAEMRMYNENRTQLKSIIWCSFVHFDLIKQQRTKHNEALMTLFESVCLPINENSFEARVNLLKK